MCSIAYGAALGDSDIVGNAMSIFKGGMASEILNGRAAMVGFTAALVVELTSGESLFAQMFNLRDVGVRVLWLPKLVRASPKPPLTVDQSLGKLSVDRRGQYQTRSLDDMRISRLCRRLCRGPMLIFLPQLQLPDQHKAVRQGFFLIPAVVILVILSSFAPKARGVEQNGLNVEAKPSWGIFTPSSERTNGRAAMIGLVALAATESIFGHALF